MRKVGTFLAAGRTSFKMEDAPHVVSKKEVNLGFALSKHMTPLRCRWLLRGSRGLLAHGDNLRGGLFDLAFELFQFLPDNIFIIRKVGFQPLQGAGFIITVNE